MAATGFFCAIAMGALIFALGQLFATPVFRVLGADPARVTQETVDHARAYYTALLFGVPFVLASCVLNNQMRFQGNAFFSMIGLVSGAVLNVASKSSTRPELLERSFHMLLEACFVKEG